MVKPPKTMQPESFDLSKTGRSSGKAFKDDSFHQYMARKIDLQRQQFGLVLPPPPPPPAQSDNDSSESSPPLPASNGTKQSSSSRKRPRSLLKTTTSPIRNIGTAKTTTTTPSTQSPASRVRFSPRDIQRKEIRNKQNLLQENDSSRSSSMTSILHNLQQRHGSKLHRLKKKRKKRSRRRKEVSSSSHHIFDDGCKQQQQQQSQQQESEKKKKSILRHDEVNSNHSSIQDHDEISSQSQTQHQQNRPEQCTMTSSQSSSVSSSQQQPHLSLSSTTTQQQSQSPPPMSIQQQTEIRQERSDLFFLGIVVKVNGYTDPDNVTIKRLLQKHGGDLETYETIRVTHIIAENLSKAKSDAFKKQRNPRPVCKPSWIVDSVNAERLLPFQDYLLDSINKNKDKNGGQTKIQSLFSSASCLPAKKLNHSHKNRHHRNDYDDVEECFDEQRTAQQQTDCVPDTEIFNGDDRLSEQMSGLEEGTTILQDRSSPKQEEMLPGKELIGSIDDKPNPEDTSGTNQNVDTRDFSAIVSDEKPPTSLKKYNSGKTDGKYIDGKIRTTGTDPNFLDSFFANSRLSFIGSYKQRNTTSVSSPSKKSSNGLCKSKNLKRWVFHVDMDCFFAAVVLRNFPEYKDKPVAISHHGKKGKHSSSTTSPHEPEVVTSKNSTSECATCNYKAREYGIYKGMFLGRAKQLCPELVVLSYDFEGYEEVSEQVQDILYRVAADHEGTVEAVSCDEAYMELYLDNDTEKAKDIAERIRADIFETTQCTASIGIAENKFLSKLGTDHVKPDGSYVVADYKHLLNDLQLRDLHGIGYRSEPKLKAEGLISVQDVWDCKANAKGLLSRIIGPALGKKIYDFCHGKDGRPVQAAERKTIGAECNYGVRFDGPYGIDHFMLGLAQEVQKRMEGVGVTGRHVTLKLKKRKNGAKPPPKFLGHGSCHNISKGRTIPGSTLDAKIICDVGMDLFKELAIPLDDVRGMGIIMSKLNRVSSSSDGGGTNSGLAGWLSRGGMTEKNVDDDESREANNENGRLDESSRLEGGRNKHLEEEKIQHDDRTTNNLTNGPNHDDIAIHTDLERNFADEEMLFAQALDDNEDNELTAQSGAQRFSSEIILPPMSQIRLSQLDALPDDMREEIQASLKEASSERRSQHRKEIDSNFAAIDLTTGSDEKKSDSTTATIQRVDSNSLCDPSKTTTATATCQEGRFRQTDLKRLMKLADVKSGKIATDISLTQLDNLPLEIKLQVVNEDNSPVGFLSQNKKNITTASRTASTASHPYPKKKQRVEPSKVTGRTDEDSISSPLKPDNDSTVTAQITNGEPVRIDLEWETEVDDEDFRYEEDDSSVQQLEGPSNLFEEDILPLKVFLDENDSGIHEAVEQVCEFLSLCLKEGRLSDLGAMARSIQRRTDGWSSNGILRIIGNSLNEEHIRIYGCHIDVDWLFGGNKLK